MGTAEKIKDAHSQPGQPVTSYWITSPRDKLPTVGGLNPFGLNRCALLQLRYGARADGGLSTLAILLLALSCHLRCLSKA